MAEISRDYSAGANIVSCFLAFLASDSFEQTINRLLVLVSTEVAHTADRDTVFIRCFIIMVRTSPTTAK